MTGDISIREAIQSIVADGNEIYAKVCSVVNVYPDAKTVDVEPIDGTAWLRNVPLQASTSGNGLVSIPAKGSKVLVVFTSKHTAVVCQVSEVTMFRYEQDGLVLELDSEAKKVQITNGTVSLLQLFTELNELLTNLKVLTPQGPSEGLSPESLIDLEKFGTNFRKLLK